MIKISIILNLLNQIINNIVFDFPFLKYSKITLRITGKDESAILGNELYYNFTGINYLKAVKINGNLQDKISYSYPLGEDDNFVELFWEENINNCKFMFSGCKNITEIDFSNFDTSLVTSMNSMFSHCSSLIKLNLSNFNTSLVSSMYSMFFFVHHWFH